MPNDRHSAAPAIERVPSIEQLRMLVPAYVLGALDASERAAFERGLATPAMARILQGEIELHRASIAALTASTARTTEPVDHPATGRAARPSVRIDTSAYRDDEQGETERPKRPTPMYGTAYRVEEWGPTEASKSNGRSYKPAKARRARESERHAERADRVTPRAVRAQAPAEPPRRAVPPASPTSAGAAPRDGSATDSHLDLPSIEAAVDDLFSDAWSSAPARTSETSPTSSAQAVDAANLDARGPVVRRAGNGSPTTRNASSKAHPVAPRASQNGTVSDEALDDMVDEAYAPRSRRGARGTPWAMLTLGAIAVGAIAMAAWQGMRAARLQDRLLLQPALDAAVAAPPATPKPAVAVAPTEPTAVPAVAVAAPSATPTAATAEPSVAPGGSADESADRLATLFDATRGVQVVHLLATTSGSAAGAQLFWNTERGTGVVHAFGMAPIAADRSYTLWMLQRGQPVAVARFRPNDRGAALIPNVPMPTSTAQIASFAVSVEPYGGSPRPSAAPLLVGDLPGAGTKLSVR